MSRCYNVIGSGFSGLSAAAFLAKSGKKVNIIEKNQELGGRARQFSSNGFLFDMGPSWYWMPDVFDKFFSNFQKTTSDYYKLKKLDPGFQIIFDQNHTMKLHSDWSSVLALFEEYEKGAADKLIKFMKDAEIKYNVGMKHLVYNPGTSLSELFNKDIWLNIGKMNLFRSYRNHVYKYFKNPFLRKLLEFPVLFLGTSPSDTPALYSLMAYSGISQGTYYPMGGFGEVIKGMVNLCESLGVNFYNNNEVTSFSFNGKKIDQIITSNSVFKTDEVICSADYNHFDQNILPKEYRNYSHKYWDKRVMSPSSLLFYLGVDVKLKNLEHHNLFFDEDIECHIKEIYKDIKWPTDPLFYVCCPSKTDPKVAPKGKENLFLLMPLAAGLKDSKDLREVYFKKIISRLEKYCETDLSNKICFKKSYCIDDFKSDYYAFKGNAYGLANTLFQTANLKPKIKNRYVSNLFYTGQLTVPGPGVPPAIISGNVVADYILKQKY